MTEQQKIILELKSQIAEMHGMLLAITCWDIPKDLKDRLDDYLREVKEI